MLSEDKFYDKAVKFNLFPTTDNKYLTFDELKEKTIKSQTDKDDKLIQLYASNVEEQHSYIEIAKSKGYIVLLLDSPIIGHLLQKFEQKDSKISFVRVDSDNIDKLINKDEKQISKLSDSQKDKLKSLIEEVISDKKYIIQLEAMQSDSLPFMITQPEFMRRMKEMQQTSGNSMFGGGFPETFQLIVNVNHQLITEILETKTKKKQERLVKQSLDLAKLSQSLLKGEELSTFIKRSFDMIK